MTFVAKEFASRVKEATDGEVINGHYGIDCRTVLVRKMGQEILWAKVAKTATYMLAFCRKRVFERFEAPEIIGAPERIRTSDPQIRSYVAHLLMATHTGLRAVAISRCSKRNDALQQKTEQFHNSMYYYAQSPLRGRLSGSGVAGGF